MTYRYKTRPFPHQRKAFAETVGLAAYGLLWEQGCVDSVTQCLTPDGWVSIDKWAGQPIADWDPDTRQCKFIVPEYFKQAYDGPMYVINGDRLPEQVVCPAHSIPIMDKRGNHLRGSLQPQQLMDELHSGVDTVRRLPAQWVLNDAESTGLEGWTDEQIRLQIAVMADGSFPKNAPGTRRVVIRLKRQRKIDRLRTLLANTPGVYERRSADFIVFSFQAPARLKQWPHEWWRANKHQRQVMLDELVHWDGSMADDGRGWKFYSRHESDVDIVQFLAGSEGLVTRKYWSSDIWNISVRGTNTNGFSIRASNITVSVPPRDGHKYCFKTPSGFWIARRDGYVYPTGNCGKTKPLIDTTSFLYQEGKIRGAVIVAPNGVHRNWMTDEIPAHMPDDIRAQVKFLLWESKKVKNKSFEQAMRDILSNDGLSIVLVCYEATIRPKAKGFIQKFLKSRQCVMILDESHKIKDPDSKVKTTTTALGRYAPYRRIATGTPIEKPFDIYAQLRFLQPTFWKDRGFETYTDFKEHFGIFAARTFGGREVSQLVAHKNLEELAKYVGEIAWRLTKEDAGLNLPPKLYTRRYVEMTDEQWRVYNQLRDEGLTRLSSGDELAASMAMTKMLRLQQITCGYVACEAEQPVQWINPDGKNPRMDVAVDDVLLEYSGQAIVFSRFTKDIDQLCYRLGKDAVRYDGQVGDDDRAHAKKRFQSGDAKYFVMSNAGSTGLTLVGAGLFMHYNSDFRLIDRLQREDRCHRIGQTKSVEYMDLICPGTMDEYIVDALVKKKDIVDQVTQDAEIPWLIQ